MAYEVRYTDEINKGVIVVEDRTINTETSIGFPGRQATSYGQTVAENFLHMLENFANTTPPARPVEGQLWYDNTDGIDQLKIYDGTAWSPAGGLKKSDNEPEVSNSVAGDLWVNTENQQLYLFSGSAWILVGPQFSDGLLTGGESQVILGIDNQEYNIFVIKMQGQISVIFSNNAFVPKIAIPGFRTGIKAGINLIDTANNFKYYGTSEKAEALVVTGEIVPAKSFLRSDKESVTDFRLRVKTNDGLQVGTGNQVGIYIDNESGVIQHNTGGSNFLFKLSNGTNYKNVLTIDSSEKVGINNLRPDQELDVVGNVRVSPKLGNPNSGVINVDSVIDSNNVNQGSIVTKGGLGVSLNTHIGGDLFVNGTAQTTNLVPDAAGTRSIGTPLRRYEQVYASTFFGNLQGNVTGTVSGRAGSANRLTSATTFAVSGDVENSSFDFDGTGGTKTFDIRISNSFISSKDSVSDALNSDEILINRTTGNTGVYRIDKRNFLKTLNLIPAGVIVPFGGTIAPSGWLICDGSEVRKSDYGLLWEAIGFNFKDPALISDNGVQFFALPDFRGRFPLGIDNMGSRGPANTVTNSAADTIGNFEGSEFKNIDLENLPEHEHDMEGEGGTQYYGIRVGSGPALDTRVIDLTIESGTGGTQGLPSSGGILTDNSLGQPLDVMNPYLTVTYIIYTGN
jgi:microcystin-dependent protein